MIKCFKCEKEVFSAVIGRWKYGAADPEKVWDMPDGVLFTGGWNFGSSVYDAMLDGLHVEIIICDKCIRAAGDDMKKEVQQDNGFLKSKTDPTPNPNCAKWFGSKPDNLAVPEVE